MMENISQHGTETETMRIAMTVGTFFSLKSVLSRVLELGCEYGGGGGGGGGVNGMLSCVHQLMSSLNSISG